VPQRREILANGRIDLGGGAGTDADQIGGLIVGSRKRRSSLDRRAHGRLQIASLRSQCQSDSGGST
jgi:hypothetical protein